MSFIYAVYTLGARLLRTFDGLPVIVAIASRRRELGVVVMRLPHVDVLVLRAADDVLAVVTAKTGYRIITLCTQKIRLSS